MPPRKKPPERLRRRNAPEQWTVLPAGGCKLPAPDLAARQADRRGDGAVEAAVVAPYRELVVGAVGRAHDRRSLRPHGHRQAGAHGRGTPRGSPRPHAARDGAPAPGRRAAGASRGRA